MPESEARSVGQTPSAGLRHLSCCRNGAGKRGTQWFTTSFLQDGGRCWKAVSECECGLVVRAIKVIIITSR